MIFTKVIEEGTERVMYAQMLDTNIFTNCGHCNTELEVNRETLRQILSSETSLEGVKLFCDEHCKHEFVVNNLNEEEVTEEEINEEENPLVLLTEYVEHLPLTDEEKSNLGSLVGDLIDMVRNDELTEVNE